MERVSSILLLLLITCLSYAQSRKILIVSTNIDTVGTYASGSFLKEIAYPFQYFIDRGFEVDIVTPKGGRAAIYHMGATPEELSRIEKSELFQKKIKSTLEPAQIKPNSYSAIFYPGGHGQYFDVIDDERIALIARKVHENHGVIGTAGHGAAALINIQLSDCRYLVTGKRITCFPHWAELAYMNISNFGKLLPFDMEEVLARRGADLVVCRQETRSNAALTLVVDTKNRIVTGAFASSAQWVAEQMVQLINDTKAKK